MENIYMNNKFQNSINSLRIQNLEEPLNNKL